jgi:hypothetical protein
MRARPFTATTLRMFAGVLIWAAHFTAIYSFNGIACARGFAESELLGVGATTWAIGTATAIAIAAILIVLVPAARRARGSFEEWMAAGVAALALVAIVFETIPVFMVPPCA